MVTSIILLDRVRTSSPYLFVKYDWATLFLCSLILGDKTLEDCTVKVGEFAAMFPSWRAEAELDILRSLG
jgi:hypothetical protein